MTSSNANLNPSENNNRLVKTSVAAGMLQIGHSMLAKLIRSRALKPTRIGRSVRIRIGELEDFIARCSLVEPIKDGAWQPKRLRPPG